MVGSKRIAPIALNLALLLAIIFCCSYADVSDINCDHSWPWYLFMGVADEQGKSQDPILGVVI